MFVGDSHDDGGPNGVDIVATRCLTEVHIIATMVDGLAGRGGDCPLAELETRFLQLCQLGNCTPAETKTNVKTKTKTNSNMHKHKYTKSKTQRQKQ